jgi:hypothetical protein
MGPHLTFGRHRASLTARDGWHPEYGDGGSDEKHRCACSVVLPLTLVGRTRHVMRAAALGLGAVELASVTYQSYGMARDRRRYPPPGGG